MASRPSPVPDDLTEKGLRQEEQNTSFQTCCHDKTSELQVSVGDSQKDTGVPSVITDAVSAHKSLKEGQNDLQDLNVELKVLNEESSLVSSILHNQVDSVENVLANSYSEMPGTRKARKRKDPGDASSSEGCSNLVKDKIVAVKRKKGPKTKLKEPSENEVVDLPFDATEEIDSILDEKACKTNLTAVNVKNILRYVITNEHVLSMVRNSMKAECSENLSSGNDALVEAFYEPKLTRSKAKELVEKKVRIPWPISPIKTPSKPRKNLIELDFSESEATSDEEYKPEKESESEGEERLLQSQANVSESSSAVLPLSEESKTELVSSDNITEDQEYAQDIIALRTRSKLPLNDTPLESIESTFIAPDITTDMYESNFDDEDWRNFLNEFLKPLNSDVNDVIDDEINDPEYNFLVEDDVPDSEDFRNDKAVKISKKEINALMAELLEVAHEELKKDEEEEDEKILKHVVTTRDFNETQSDVKSNEPLFCEDAQQLLAEQMRQHVQLLAQAFLLSSNIKELDAVRTTSKALILELQNLAINNQLRYQLSSAFQAHNLQAAIEIINSYDEKSKSIDNVKSKLSSQTPCRRKVSDDTAKVISNSSVFIYPHLLPVGGFCLPSNSKQLFTKAEDMLLSMGLEQFNKLKKDVSCWKLIKDNMLPVKSPKQIFIRAKNLRSTRAESSPVKHYYQFKKAPLVNHSVKPFDPSSVKPPVGQTLKLLPEWLRTYIQKYSLAPCRKLLPTDKPHFMSTSNQNCNEMAIIESSDQSNTTDGTLEQFLLCKLDKTKCANVLQRDQVHTSVAAVQRTITPGSKVPENGGDSSSLNSSTVPGNTQLCIAKMSLMKHVSPILKKYSAKGLRKTGGNLRKVPVPILPKVVFVSSGRRLLAPKPTVVEMVKSAEQKSTDESNTKSNIVKITVLPESSVMATTLVSNSGAEQSQDVMVKDVISDAESEAEVEQFDDGDDTADDEGIDMQGDNEDDLAALMEASTTIKSTPKNRQSMLRKKKKQQQDKEDMIAEDLIESDPLKQEREAAFAQAFLQKVKDTLTCDVHLFEDFLQLLHEFNQKEGDVVQLYKDVCVMLKDFPQLCEEFVAFLLPEQALECGKFMEYLALTKMQVFLRKLEVHFGKHHLQKILKLLHQMQNQENLTIEILRETMSPVLRGQKHVMEDFLQLFPDAAPSDSNINDFEEVVIPDGDGDIPIDDDGYEIVELPDVDDMYGTKDCICHCHNSSNKPKVQNKLHHCMRCGIKFIDGRIFLQTGKVLKPCRVIYHSSKESQISQTQNPNGLKADEVSSPVSSVSTLSPPASKESDDEHGLPLVSTLKKNTECNDGDLDMPTNPFLEALEQISQEDGSRFNLPAASATATEDAILTSDGSTNPQFPVPSDFSILRKVICTEQTADNVEFEVYHEEMDTHKNSVESTANSPNNSRVRVTETSHQQEISSVEDEHKSSISPDHIASAQNHTVDGQGNVIVLWTREYDRVLLQTCQQLGASKATFEKISAKLQTKSPDEVENRFRELMNLFAQDSNKHSEDMK